MLFANLDCGRILNIANTEGGDIVYDTFIDWAFNSAKVSFFFREIFLHCRKMEVFMDQILQQYAPVDREHIPFLPGFLVSQPSTLCLVTLCFSICGALHAMAQYIPYDGLKHKCPSLLRCHACNVVLGVHICV